MHKWIYKLSLLTLDKCYTFKTLYITMEKKREKTLYSITLPFLLQWKEKKFTLEVYKSYIRGVNYQRLNIVEGDSSKIIIRECWSLASCAKKLVHRFPSLQVCLMDPSFASEGA